jgi:hypothetical protein
MQWLASELRDAEKNGERVIVASHVPLSRTAARPGMAAWNCDEVSALLEASPAVALCVAGHDHPGRYGRTLVPASDAARRDGSSEKKVGGGESTYSYKTFGRVHYVTLEAMLEAPEDGNAFAALEVYDHEVIVNAGGVTRGFFGDKYSATSLKKNSARSTKNYATDRRLRVSPRGRFTGVASFSERVPGSPGSRDDRDGASASIRVAGSNQQAVDLLDWINANADDEDADMT